MTDAIRKYDDVETDWTNKMMPGDYEPVYHEPNYIHVDKPTGECVLFDDATYGVKPHDYEVVCQNPNDIQEKRPTSEYVYFNDGKYVNDDIEMSPTENENHPHTYVNDIEKTSQGLAQCHVYEAVYHKPSATRDENSTSMHANIDDGKHSGTVSRAREKAQPGKDIVESTSNEMLQTMHNALNHR